ncbi:chemotaxis protein [Methylobacterium sp. Leaf361]|uniref:methyl-accepting chemotaxis protein n=1 Tax=Methylobacterium sp. Leaf361 TaxID=1736352 RepID=UPI0006F5C4EE|nr:methyl-accepting chemotaxis protein [Methylobacterium sp. Leaf361]KQS75487.1 chemotaxis protein [Methylobacterium sp. Leaf361]
MISLSRLSTRLPATTVGLALLSATAMGGFSWYSARAGLMTAAHERLELAAAARRDAIELVADRAQADFLAVAAHPQIVSNFPDLLENLDPAKPDTESVIAAFRAPQTAEARVALDGSGMSSMYARRHVKVQEVARKLVAQPGYADLMFIDDNGRIDYTTTKGADFGKAVTEDGLAGTALARLVERLKSADPGAVLYEDFAAYAVDGVPAAFLGRAMTKRANVAMGTAQAAERIGFIVMRVTPALFDQTLSKRTGLGDTGQILAVGADGLLRSNPPLNPGVRAGAGLAGIGLAADRVKAGGPVDFAAENGTHMAAASPVTVLGAPWTVVAEQTQAEAIDAVQALSRTLILTGLFVLAGTALLGLLLARSIVAPLGALTRALKALADRQALTDVPGSARRDEIGDIARAVVTIRDMSLEEAAQQLQTTEAARLREEQSRRAMLKQLADGFEHSVGGIVEGLTGAVTELQGASDTMRAAVSSTSERSTSVAGAAQQTSDNVNTVAAAAEELGATVQEIGRQVEQAAGMSATAVGEARRAEQTMTDLAAAATRIGDVVGMVSTIAGQTNLLALNATIEAARAGEAGRGFAVVAAEVKELAAQTTRATEEISRQVASIQTVTGDAAGAIQGITAQIEAMNQVSTSIAAAVDQQGVTTQDIVRSMGQASAGTGTMTLEIAEVARVAGDAGEAADSVAQASDSLATRSEQLRAEVAQFLRNVRAA